MNKIPKIESLSVEFKSSFNEEVIETLVAFSNAKGGTVFVGVSDTGNAQGITVGKETIQKWINEIKNKTTPQIIPDVEIRVVDNKNVISLSIHEYPIKPVSTKGKYYKRIGNSNHLLSIDEIANEHLKTINSSWDFYIDHNHSIANLSEEKIAKFVNVIKQNESIHQVNLSDIEILNKMEILRTGKVTFGAYLLFVKDYCAISDVQIGRFKSDITIIDSISLNSDLFKEIDDIMAFIKKHLKIEYIITGEPRHIERFDYPLDAIREIVVNMVIHRDYRDSSASIIKIFDNRIEFYNPGKLYDGLTVQDLLSGNYTSKSRNKLVSKAFKEIGIIERYGSGIMRVRKICEEYGVKEPDFQEVFNGFRVILYNERIDAENVSDYFGKNSEEAVEKSREKTVLIGRGKSREKIIALMKNNPTITQNNIADVIKLSIKTVEKNIRQLKAKGLIERIGADKGGYWKVTEKSNKNHTETVEKSRGKTVLIGREKSREKIITLMKNNPSIG